TYALLGDLVAARVVLARAIDSAGMLKEPVVAAEAGALLAWVELRSGRAEVWNALAVALDKALAPLEDPANRALVLLYAARSAVEAKQAERAVAITERLTRDVSQGALGDYQVAARGARGQALVLLGEIRDGIELLEQAAADAARGGLR